MIYLAIVAAVFIVITLQSKIWKSYALKDLEYRVEVSADEVFEDEEIYVYEELRNNKLLPLPFLKVDTELPEGLSFHLFEEEGGGTKDVYPRVVHSVFVLRSRQMIRRRWRVKCDVRGTYTLGSVTMMADDVFGLTPVVRIREPEEGDRNTVVVLPKAVDLEKEFSSSRYTSGDFLVQSSLLTDPLLRAGVREYLPGDPMNRINWNQTAVHASLMTNVEEFTNRHQFNIIMNMQGRDIEKVIPGPPSVRGTVELCMTVAASILDSVSSENVPVRLITNTPPEQFGPDSSDIDGADEDPVGSKVFVSPPFKGRSSVLGALRMLAQMELMISVPVEKMLDHILVNPYAYTNGGNIVFLSAYLSERMINFAYAMRRIGIAVVFYITSTNLNAAVIPEDIEVHYKTFVED
ncbi:MAG: DUF58 domain-containing protein [Ruminococcaceae bacterium]|jgi:uncharacterized protein (DUF58 family)|nr:DUF58 domain-containing protein [Oscillospiraceae bacterium]